MPIAMACPNLQDALPPSGGLRLITTKTGKAQSDSRLSNRSKSAGALLRFMEGRRRAALTQQMRLERHSTVSLHANVGLTSGRATPDQIATSQNPKNKLTGQVFTATR